MALDSVTMATTSIIPTATLKTTAKPDSTSSNLSGCGVSQSKAPVDYDRIINGQSVYSNTWPWLVSLQTSSGSHFVSQAIDEHNTINFSLLSDH